MSDFNFNIVKTNYLNEMAYTRSNFKNKLVNLTWQIAENWILIRYCSIIKRDKTKRQWQNELYQNLLKPLYDDKIKKIRNQKESKYSIFIQYWINEKDFDKRPETVFSNVKEKIKKENINVDDYNVRKAIIDLCDYGFKDIAYLISYGTEEDIKDYAYGDLDKLEI